jgi:hypothetical protein
LGRDCGQALRLQRNDDDIDFADFGQIISGVGLNLELADFAANTKAAFLHCAQVRSTGNQRNVFTGPR